MSITQTVATKLFVSFVVVSMLFSLSFAPAKAATTEELQAQITALLAQIASLQGQLGGGATTGGSCTAFTMDLAMGASGAEVTALQNFLMAHGQTIAAGATGYFGAQTQAALAAFQTAQGISPAAGYFGPVTRAKVNGMCTAAPAGDDDANDDANDDAANDDTDLQGGAGAIEDVDYVSSLNNEEVGEGDEDVEVVGFEVEADEGSDLEITALKLNFDQESGTTADFEDYADKVTVWFGDEMVAELDADTFNDDNDFQKTVSLDAGVIVREGETETVTVAVSAVGNLDSSDIGDEWTLELESVRFKDAQDATVTDDSTGVINDGAGRTFSFESFATAADLELHIGGGDDEINDSQTITIDDNDDTENVEVLSFTLEAEGDSDLDIKKFGVNFDVTGESHVDDVIAGGANPAIRLMIDGEEYGDAEYFDDADGVDVGTDEDVLFDDVDYVIPAGETVDVVVEVDLLSTGDGLAEGSTIQANVGETETDQATLVDVEDEQGDSLVDDDITGSESGDAHSMYENGIIVTAVSTDADPNDAEDVGTFKVVVDITANGDEDQFIYKDGDTASSATSGFIYTVYTGGVATSSFAGTKAEVLTAGSDGDDTSTYFYIEAGQTRRFTLTVTLDPNVAGLYNIELDSVRFDGSADSSAVDDETFAVPSSQNVETDPINLKAS